ncbi:50S ribosomal protein L6 [Candidatus Dojkabacteria bacterium]|uniref:Large ribosomal subunit protein uL6 n=1 Tax=Candidatus Dojkabacteria bacterium TaxID=2099670 RepID=A0A955KWL5_9BACT|nr:50S ribosomal protein L6 [Candidatus Dojkabacteria bacterium]MCB9790795.1 50S ribosomal protein L6 [Candidatus Nomurabacteria bacterium]
MSRIGNTPITIEEGVVVKINGQNVDVNGTMGNLSFVLPSGIIAKVEGNQLVLSRDKETKEIMSLHGTYRAILANAVKGVKEGFTKKLEIVGVGFRARMDGLKLSLSLGWNHPVEFDIPEGLKTDVPDESTIVITGFDKQKVGEFAAKIRKVRPPEPYKGKGIRYEGEYVRQKSPKAVVSAK